MKYFLSFLTVGAIIFVTTLLVAIFFFKNEKVTNLSKPILTDKQIETENNNQLATPTTTNPPAPETPALEIKSIKNNVPFTVQAPFSQWKDPVFQDACEEASVLMAIKWIRSEEFNSKQTATNEILAISNWEIEKYNSYHDTSASDTIERIFKQYFRSDNAKLKNNVSLEEIITELQKGNLIIAPMNGQTLKNPYFTAPGPERHMVLITGYDKDTNEFITNDPGVSQGKDYRYKTDVFF